MAHYGYIRVSTADQTTENQRLEIINAGFAINEYFSDDGVSGSKKAFERPAFARMLAVMKSGDTIVVTKVDRLGRNAGDVLQVADELKRMGIGVKIIQLGGADLTSSAGKLLLTMLAAVAEMERSILIERTVSGMQRTKAQGTRLGAPLTIEPSTLNALIRAKEEGLSVDKVAASFNIPRNTAYRNIRTWAGKMEEYTTEWNIRQQQYKEAA